MTESEVSGFCEKVPKMAKKPMKTVIFNRFSFQLTPQKVRLWDSSKRMFSNILQQKCAFIALKFSS